MTAEASRQAGAIPGPVVQDTVIPAREFIAIPMKVGQVLRIIDLEGVQVPDLIAFNAKGYDEKLSMVYSRTMNSTWHFRKGTPLYTNRCTKMLSIVEDTVGKHYTGGGYCTEALNFARHGVRGTRNCEDNLEMAIKPYGMDKQSFNPDCCFNIFMNLDFAPDGAFVIGEAFSRAGDFIDLRAEMDALIAISNCPQERNPCNGFHPTPLRVVLYQP